MFLPNTIFPLKVIRTHLAPSLICPTCYLLITLPRRSSCLVAAKGQMTKGLMLFLFLANWFLVSSYLWGSPGAISFQVCAAVLFTITSPYTTVDWLFVTVVFSPWLVRQSVAIYEWFLLMQNMALHVILWFGFHVSWVAVILIQTRHRGTHLLSFVTNCSCVAKCQISPTAC